MDKMAMIKQALMNRKKGVVTDEEHGEVPKDKPVKPNMKTKKPKKVAKKKGARVPFFTKAQTRGE